MGSSASWTLARTYSVLAGRSFGAATSILWPDEKALFVHRCRHGDIKKPHHHFIVSLLAPAHRRAGVRIVRVLLRIVVPRHGLQLRSSLQKARLSQAVTHLPVKVVINVKQGLNFIGRLARCMRSEERRVGKECRSRC